MTAAEKIKALPLPDSGPAYDFTADTDVCELREVRALLSEAAAIAASQDALMAQMVDYLANIERLCAEARKTNSRDLDDWRDDLRLIERQAAAALRAHKEQE